MDFCPECGIAWPRFCPFDGQKLDGPFTCTNAPKPVVDVAARRAQQARAEPLTTPKAQEQAAKRPAATKPAAARPAVEPQDVRALRKQYAHRVASTANRTTPPAPAPPARSPDADADPIALPAVKPPATRPDPPASAPAASRAQPATRIDTPLAPDERATDPTTERPPRVRAVEFSDTQWFLKGPAAARRADPETGVIPAETDDYRPDESISETQRRVHSLRKKDER